MARYLIKYKSFGNFMLQVGTNDDLLAEAKKYLAWLIQNFADGTYDIDAPYVRINWPSETQLLHIELYEVIWEHPEDKYWEFNEYVAEKGDPAANGLGHVSEVKFGVKVVKVPGPKIYTMKKRRIQQARIETTYGRGDFEIGEDQMRTNFTSLVNQVSGDMATGSNQVVDPATPARQALGDQSNGIGGAGPAGTCRGMDWREDMGHNL